MNVYRIPQFKLHLIRDGTVPAPTRHIVRSEEIYPLLAEYFRHHDREEMLAVLLDAKHRILGVHTVSIGTLTLSIVHPRETFKAAIVGNAAAVILAHNHPTGDPAPSSEDRALTDRLCQAGQLLGIPVLDHLVIGTDRYVSFADMGWLPITRKE